MTGRRLVLLRHGRTAWNHLGRMQGQLDVSLDDAGRAQAARVAPVLAALEPALLWSSDLARARETTAPLATATGVAPHYDARLREFGFGDLEGLTHDELRARDEALYERFRFGEYDAIPQAERTDAVRARMVEVLEELRAATPAGGTAIAVSHGAAIRVAVAALVGWPERYATLAALGNCGWVELVEHPIGEALVLAAYNRVAPVVSG